MVETHTEKRPIGYARVSTYGQIPQAAGVYGVAVA